MASYAWVRRKTGVCEVCGRVMGVCEPYAGHCGVCKSDYCANCGSGGPCAACAKPGEPKKSDLFREGLTAAPG